MAEYRGFWVRLTHYVTRRTRTTKGTPPKSTITKPTNNLLVTHRWCLPKKFLDQKFFCDQKFFRSLNFFWPKIFSDPNLFSDLKLFLTQHFFRSKSVFWPKKFFGLQIFFGPEIFWDLYNRVYPNFCLWRNTLSFYSLNNV